LLVVGGVYLLLQGVMFDPPSQSEHGDGGNKGESNKKHIVHAQLVEPCRCAQAPQVEQPRRRRATNTFNSRDEEG
jgi:hypothetical protein